MSRAFNRVSLAQRAAVRSVGALARRQCKVLQQTRAFSEAAASNAEPLAEREFMEYDVVTVGAGPAGLSAAIRIKQLAIKAGQEVSVCVIDKGAEVGAHILSGNVFEPRALNELFPNWEKMDNPPPMDTKANDDEFLVLTSNKSSVAIPHILHPPQLDNDGNYIISLSMMCKWLAEQAEMLGVEIYPGFSADEVLYVCMCGLLSSVCICMCVYVCVSICLSI